MTRLKVRLGPRAPMVTLEEIASWRQLCPPCAVEYHAWATHVFPPARRYISNTPQLTRMNYGAEKEKQRETRSHYLRSIKANCPGKHHQRGPAFNAAMSHDRLVGCPTIRSFWETEARNDAA